MDALFLLRGREGRGKGEPVSRGKQSVTGISEEMAGFKIWGQERQINLNPVVTAIVILMLVFKTFF